MVTSRYELPLQNYISLCLYRRKDQVYHLRENRSSVLHDTSSVRAATFPSILKISLFQFWTGIPIGFVPCNGSLESATSEETRTLEDVSWAVEKDLGCCVIWCIGARWGTNSWVMADRSRENSSLSSLCWLHLGGCVQKAS